MQELRIDEEFRNKIPPLTDEEFKQLEQNILEDGEIHTPIVVWNGIIVDGHNRWKIIQNHPEIPYKVKEMNFADKWEAFDWMYKNQLGRRNLTEEQVHYLRGQLYKARKHTVGFHTESRNADGTFQSAQNEHTGGGRVSEQLAKELGVGKDTIKRAEHYADGIDAIRKEDKKVADDILSGKIQITKKEVMDVGKAETEKVKAFVNDVKKGVKKPKQPQKPRTPKDTESIKEIKKDIEQSRTITAYIPTVDDLIHDLRNNAVPFIRLFNQLVDGYADVIKGNSESVLMTIKECIEDEIIKLKEKITNEYAQ